MLKVKIINAVKIMVESISIRPINSREYDKKRKEASRALKEAYGNHSIEIKRRICEMCNKLTTKQVYKIERKNNWRQEVVIVFQGTKEECQEKISELDTKDGYNIYCVIPPYKYPQLP